MNHPAKSHLLVLLDENPGDLSDQELTEFIWLVEQLLQELRQRTVDRRDRLAQENPVRP